MARNAIDIFKTLQAITNLPTAWFFRNSALRDQGTLSDPDFTTPWNGPEVVYQPLHSTRASIHILKILESPMEPWERIMVSSTTPSPMSEQHVEGSLHAVHQITGVVHANKLFR